MRRIDRCECDPKENYGKASDAGLEGDVEAGLNLGETGGITCYAKGSDISKGQSKVVAEAA